MAIKFFSSNPKGDIMKFRTRNKLALAAFVAAVAWSSGASAQTVLR